LLQGQTIPTTSSETYKGPWTTYQPSPLSQIAGLGTLFASGAGGTSAIGGLINNVAPLFKGIGDFASDSFNNFNFTPQPQTQAEQDYANSLGDFNG